MKQPKLTILYTYYGQRERLKGIQDEKHKDTRVIIVDDGHPDAIGTLVGVDVYRIEEDKPWNQPTAKNLGFSNAKGWIVCADIDHLVTKENAEQIIKMKKKKGTVYFLGREDTDSWNLFLIHKDDFDKVGGYDEDFSGHYGYDDIHILWKFNQMLAVEERRDIKAKVFAKESSSKLIRDTSFNRKLFIEKTL